MPKKTTHAKLNKFAYQESCVADHPDPAKRQAPDDTLNHNADLLDQHLKAIYDRLHALDGLGTL